MTADDHCSDGQKRVEQALDLFKEALNNSTDAIGMSTPDGRHFYQNRACDALFGEVGEYPIETVYVDRQVGEDVFRTVMAGGQWSGEVRMYAADRRILDVSLRAYANRDENGNILSLVGIHNDITERKQAEEALRQSKERYKTIVSSMSDLIFVVDENDRFVDVHCGQPSNMLLLPPEEFLGKAMAEVLPPEVYEQHRACAARTRQSGEKGYYEYSLPIRGETRWFVATFDLHADGKTIVAGVREITERKRAEQALRESEAVHRVLAENSVDMISRHAADGTVLYVSPSCESLAGYTVGELLGKEAEFLVWPEDRSRVWEVIRGVPPSENRYLVEHRMCRKDGTMVWVETHGRLVRDVAGHVHEIQCNVRDVTDRKRAEEALRVAHDELQLAHDELEQRVEERTADLAAANAQLRRERKTLEHLLRASDHERQLIAYDIHDGLAQELAGAIMQFQIYEQQKDTRPSDAQKAFDGGMSLLRQAHSEARRLISGVRPPILDESGVLAAVAHLAYDPAFEQGPKVDFRSRVTFHRLDPVAENVIYRIVQEALSNARNHSRSERVVVSIVERGEVLRIEVRDWGVGFDPQEVQENRYGLEGIRERARLLGGQCDIRSSPGGGTAVIVKLPAAPPH